MHIAIIAPSHVPFIVGGAEKLWWGMQEYINKHTRHQCDLIRLPSKEDSFWNLIDTYYTFYHLDLSHFDLVISSKYPSWMVRHPNHHLYMQHTVRRLYDMYIPSAVSYDDIQNQDQRIINLWNRLDDNDSTVDEIFDLLFELKKVYGDIHKNPFELYGILLRKVIHFFDKKAMENIKYFSAISQNVAGREGYFPKKVKVEIVYHPSNLSGFKNEAYNYFFTASRLDGPKRMEIIVKAYLESDTAIPLKIAGTGPAFRRLEQLSKNDKRIELLGFISDNEMLSHYAQAYAVIFIPQDEDFGLITIEAMMCEKPVLTFSDTGGVLEFVENQVTGLVCEPNIKALTKNINYIAQRPDLCKSMGKVAKKKVENITWKNTMDKLLNIVKHDNTLDNEKRKNLGEIFVKIKNESQNGKKMSNNLKTDVSMNRPVNTPIPVNEFTKYHDDEFIMNLYRVILKREPNKEELHENLTFLRSGKMSKIDILTELRFSPEGQEKNVRIRGGRKRYIISKLLRTPFLGYLLRLVTLQRTAQRLNWLEAKMFTEINKLRSDSRNNKTDNIDG